MSPIRLIPLATRWITVYVICKRERERERERENEGEKESLRKEQGIINCYQVSNQCMALVRDDCLVPTLDAPELGYIRESTNERYIPDVFYKVSTVVQDSHICVCVCVCVCV